MTDLAGRYGVILADPPWTFATWSHKRKGRSAEAHYDCMSLDQIKDLPVNEWAAGDCALFLWVLDSMLDQGLEVIRSWGFTYKTIGFVWAKLNPRSVGYYMGLGRWTRANPEICLLATRGQPRRMSALVRKLIVSPRREHSRKPDEAYERIEALCDGPYLELFARFSRPGWDALGDQVKTGPGERRWASNAYPTLRRDVAGARKQ
jgi:N6-adenosine-specific RNA methylase IME4